MFDKKRIWLSLLIILSPIYIALIVIVLIGVVISQSASFIYDKLYWPIYRKAGKPFDTIRR